MRRTLLPSPWQRVDAGAGKLQARYAHPAGYRIEHCGHPTALWPYALYGPDRKLILAANGRAFQNLKLAAVAVDKLLMAGCPTAETIACYIDRRGLSLAERAIVEAHLAICKRCTEVVANVVKDRDEILKRRV